jgi:hypothetical protein
VAELTSLEAKFEKERSELREAQLQCQALAADVETQSDVNKKREKQLVAATDNLRVVADLCVELEVADVSTLSDVVLENKERLQTAEEKLKVCINPLSYMYTHMHTHMYIYKPPFSPYMYIYFQEERGHHHGRCCAGCGT